MDQVSRRQFLAASLASLGLGVASRSPWQQRSHAPAAAAPFELTREDQPGFWERYGYHNDADPFEEQRYGF